MHIRIDRSTRGQKGGKGFSLVEMVVALAIMGVVFIALYAGIANGYKTVGLAREDARATQILLEKSETLRLYTWDQVTNAAFPNFTVSYYTDAIGNSNGVVYTGTFGITNIDSSKIIDDKLKNENYSDDMRVVTITLKWQSTSGLKHTRTLSTLVAAEGIHNYVY